MAAGDTAHWLQNKLGLTDDLWSGRTICAQLNVERLQNIKECFPALFPHVKVKLLLSFLHLPRRNIEQWQEELKDIIDLALSETNTGSLDKGGMEDSWVTMVAKILRHYPRTGTLNLGLEEDSDYFRQMLEALRRTAEKAGSSSMLPLEFQYLNKKALDHTTGQIPQFTRYFQIKRKPKSATLRADIVSKSNEVAANKKKNMPNSVPIKSRSFLKKMDTTTPMKGIPSRAPPSSKFHSSPSSSKNPPPSGPSVTVTPLGNTWVTNRPGAHQRKEGGVKFLDIGEQPVGAREAKKRKRQADLEAMEQQRKVKLEAAAAAAAAASAASSTAPPQSVTPDYAAGLMAPATPKMPTPLLLATTASLTVPGPSYVPSTARAQPAPTTVAVVAGGAAAATLGGVGALSTQQQARKTLHSTLVTTTTAALTLVRPPGATFTPAPPLSPAVVVGGGAKPAVVAAVSGAVSAVPQPTTIIVQAAAPQQLLKAQQGHKVLRLPAATATVHLKGQVGVVGGPGLQVRLAAPPPPPATQPQQPQQQQTVTTTVTTQAATQPKKGLSLTRDQMMEAQEMFRVSNKVSRPEKALILGFMAGSRENPCPQQGSVLNIKLSENEETVAQADGTQKTVMVDTYFQMNYDSGEWKRFKKYRAGEAS